MKRKKGESKVGFAQREFKAGKLHSGSKRGPKVTNPKQAIAIGLNQARKEGDKVAPRKKAASKSAHVAHSKHRLAIHEKEHKMLEAKGAHGKAKKRGK